MQKLIVGSWGTDWSFWNFARRCGRKLSWLGVGEPWVLFYELESSVVKEHCDVGAGIDDANEDLSMWLALSLWMSMPWPHDFQMCLY